MSSLPLPVAWSVELTPEEAALFDFLDEVVRENDLATTMRVAGGWVRDKLLGAESDDIDIALDDMMGAAFAEVVNASLRKRGEHASSIGEIKSNPEQSKHLDTATMKIHGIWIDLVNLRHESYTDSRIPDSVAIGTPEQDAHRRDLTINALFYNINTRTVEDFTGRGLRDLLDGVIRTPLPPLQTFLDDPLRVLRCVRFAARYDFELVDDVPAAIRDEEVQLALQTKVSRERYGIEVGKMLKHPTAADRALKKLVEIGICPIVFALPDESDAADPYAAGALAAERMCELRRAGTPLEPEDLDKDTRRPLVLSAFLLPLFGQTYPGGRNGAEEPVTRFIIKESLKLPHRDAQLVELLHEASHAFVGLLPEQGDVDAVEGLSRLDLGLAVRSAKGNWRLSLLLAAVALTDAADNLAEHPTVLVANRVAERIEALGLGDAHKMKPLLNGKKVMELLELEPGPIIRDINEAVIRFQLDNADATVESVTAFVQAEFGTA